MVEVAGGCFEIDRAERRTRPAFGDQVDDARAAVADRRIAGARIDRERPDAVEVGLRGTAVRDRGIVDAVEVEPDLRRERPAHRERAVDVDLHAG